MRTAAQLHTVAGNRDDADAVTVLLAEERGGAGGNRILLYPSTSVCTGILLSTCALTILLDVGQLLCV